MGVLVMLLQVTITHKPQYFWKIL